MRPVAVGPCHDLHHEGHDVVARSYPVGPEGHPRGLLTLWRCPVEGWGGFWHDLARDPTNVGGGPGVESLPPRDAADPEPRRWRLFHRD